MRSAFFLIAALAVALALAACAQPSSSASSDARAAADTTMLDPSEADTAVFAGGCFWCMEPPYDKLSGVAKTISGFAGGSVPNPTYKQVTRGGTGHAEAVQVIYDPEQVSYEALLTVYWRNVDPLDAEGQFCDRGASYRPVIFARTARQERLAEASKAEVAERFEEEIVVPVVRETDFYAAEDYHQNYYQKEPRRYKTYRTGCRRDARLQALWGEEAGGVHLVQPEAGR